MDFPEGQVLVIPHWDELPENGGHTVSQNKRQYDGRVLHWFAQATRLSAEQQRLLRKRPDWFGFFCAIERAGGRQPPALRGLFLRTNKKPMDFEDVLSESAPTANMEEFKQCIEECVQLGLLSYVDLGTVCDIVAQREALIDTPKPTAKEPEQIRRSTPSRPKVDPKSTDSRPAVDRQSTRSRPTVDPKRKGDKKERRSRDESGEGGRQSEFDSPPPSQTTTSGASINHSPRLAEVQFLKLWNESPATAHITQLTEKQRIALRERLMDDNWQRMHWRGIRLLGKTAYWANRSMSVDQFLSEEMLEKILSGQYDTDKNTDMQNTQMDMESLCAVLDVRPQTKEENSEINDLLRQFRMFYGFKGAYDYIKKQREKGAAPKDILQALENGLDKPPEVSDEK